MLKIVVYSLFFVVLSIIIYGYYVKPTSPSDGEKIIGIGVLIFAFILMPLFLYIRFKGRDLSHYTFNQPKKDQEEKK